MEHGIEFEGKVDLTNPDHKFYILLDYGTNKKRAPPDPEMIYFGRWVSSMGHVQGD